LQEITITSSENYSVNSKIKNVIIGKRYKVSTEVIGIEGKLSCAYFGIDILDRNKIDSDRRIKWLNDFSGTRKTVRITFTATSDQIRMLYRINTETPPVTTSVHDVSANWAQSKASCKYKLLPLDEISIQELDTNEKIIGEDEKNIFYPRKKELSSQDELALEKNLVWIFGSTRSGTTWLATQLLSHNTSLIDEFRINLHLGAYANGMPIGTTEMVRSQDRPDYFFSFVFKNSWRFYLRKLILNRIYSQIGDLSKKIIIKEPTAGEIGVETLSDCLPNSKIIWLLRDGRDVVDSQVDAITYGFSKEGRFGSDHLYTLKEAQRLDFIGDRAKLWVKIMEVLGKAYENHPNESKFLVRYEDLRKNTAEELQKIYKFLEINIDRNTIKKFVWKFSFENIPEKDKGKGKNRRIATPGKWKENFSLNESALLGKIMNETLQKLGYSLE